MKLRFLMDENMPRFAVEAIRRGGEDVAWVRDDAPGSSDRDVFARAARERRILVTFDKDFGELARSARLPSESGVILLRLPMPPVQQAGSRLAELIASRRDWPGHFSVVEPGRIRMRLLPGPD